MVFLGKNVFQYNNSAVVEMVKKSTEKKGEKGGKRLKCE